MKHPGSEDTIPSRQIERIIFQWAMNLHEVRFHEETGGNSTIQGPGAKMECIATTPSGQYGM